MGNFEKLSVLVIGVIIVMILVVALYTWTDDPAAEETADAGIVGGTGVIANTPRDQDVKDADPWGPWEPTGDPRAVRRPSRTSRTRPDEAPGKSRTRSTTRSRSPWWSSPSSRPRSVPTR